MRSAKCRSDAGPPSADQSQRLVGGFGHSCGKVSDIYGGAAYPAFAQFASLSAKHQLNISETSANTSRISKLSAEYQRTIRRTSEHQTTIRGPSEEYQRIRPLAPEHQRRIGKPSVAQSAAYRQLRLSIRSDLCYLQIGDRTSTIPAAQPSPRRRPCVRDGRWLTPPPLSTRAPRLRWRTIGGSP